MEYICKSVRVTRFQQPLDVPFHSLDFVILEGPDGGDVVYDAKNH